MASSLALDEKTVSTNRNIETFSMQKSQIEEKINAKRGLSETLSDRLEKEKKNTDKKIADLLKNPIRRNDDDLIKSLKNKLKS